MTAAPVSGDHSTRARLAEALVAQPITFEHNLGPVAADALAELLLPVVDRIADERVAEALEEAADDAVESGYILRLGNLMYDVATAEELRARAAALRARTEAGR